MLNRVIYLAVFAATVARAETVNPTLKATILDQKYCRGSVDHALERIGSDPVRRRLLLQLQFTFQNTDPVPLILPIIDYVNKVIVSKSIHDAARNKHLLEIDVWFGPTESPDDPRGSSPGPLFRVLSNSGGSYSFHRPVLVDLEGVQAAGNKFLGKEIVLQFEIDNLHFSPEVRDEMALAWKAYGRVWNGPMKSEPIRVSIPAVPTISSCMGEFAGPE